MYIYCKLYSFCKGKIGLYVTWEMIFGGLVIPIQPHSTTLSGLLIVFCQICRDPVCLWDGIG